VHHPEVDLESVLHHCPFNFTGADFYALCSGAMANALNRRVREIQTFIAEQNDPALTARKYLSELPEEELQVTVQMSDYMDSLRDTVPSVSEDEIRHYESLRDKFSSAQSQKQTAKDVQPQEVHGSNGEHLAGIGSGFAHGDQGPESIGNGGAAAVEQEEVASTIAGAIRQCPRCNASTLKEGGCDDMTCPMCDAHYSWSTSQPIESN